MPEDTGRARVPVTGRAPAPVTGRARATVQIEDARVRVTEWRFRPGEATGHHRHEMPYVVVPMTTGSLESRGPEGNAVAQLTAGQAYTRPAGIEHDIVNANSFEFVFVEIELKS
jgi:quercetin dioxygenase-like cupin family protein